MKIEYRGLTKKFMSLRGMVSAVKDMDLEINDGEFFVLLGPSGCGKSTLLNLTAGLEKPSEGEILFGDRTVASTKRRIFEPPGKRNVAMVFQSYALYPHMNVYSNIAFPLKVAKEKKNRIRSSVDRIAGMLGIENLLDRKPAELSGGQRQRVAMARALVRRPDVFLLDEPLSNLDAQLRTSTRAELKKLQKEISVTTLYVTHDQTEAMTLGDRIALLKNGAIVQTDTPEEMYENPRSAFAATFVGSPPMNLIPADVKYEGGFRIATVDHTEVKLKGESHVSPRPGKIFLGIRPEHVEIVESETERVFSVPARISEMETLGREYLLHMRIESCDVLALTTNRKFRTGDLVEFTFDTEKARLFPRESEGE